MADSENQRRKPPDLPDTDDGHRTRVERALERCRLVLSLEFAQSEGAVTAGLPEFKVEIVPGADGAAPHVSMVNRTDTRVSRSVVMDTAGTARVFLLSQEEVHYKKLIKSLRRFAKTEIQFAAVEQLERLWLNSRSNRYRIEVIDPNGVTQFPEDGAWDGDIADRVVYSQFAHADDASNILDHVGDVEQLQAVTTLAGDLVAIVAFQEAVILQIFPELGSELTHWQGDPNAIQRRFT
ncbi:hypothetical protein [Corynebacterium variabile]|uniref:hypothetical protein n=1 Tax=Corynebacterium variabile TaxID=1727 RepID=UPI003A914B01